MKDAGSSDSSAGLGRSASERVILSTIRKAGALPSAEIARLAGLSAQSASVITRQLEADGLIVKGEPQRGKVGKPLTPFMLSGQGAYAFGLKIGRRSADLVLTDFLGRIVARSRATYRYPTPDSTLAFVQTEVARLTQGLGPAQRQRIAGLGIAMPFFIWEWASIIGVAPAAMADWQQRDIRAEIAALYDFPVLLENDATLACGAELAFGGCDTPSDFLYFYVGYFIGGGLVLNGRLFTGPSGNAGALGPMPVAGGADQQLVDVASLAGLETLCVAAGQDPALLWSGATQWQVAPELVASWMDEAAPALARAIAASVSLIDFPQVLIDGWMPASVRSALIVAVERGLDQVNLAGLRRPEIRAGVIGPDARALGAASLPLSHQFMPQV
jgi:predicted NBD/HSP70 family sugar kinase